MTNDLPFTGERFLPSVGGNIFLEHMHRYALAARLVSGKDVLDVASGEGFGSKILSQHARSVIGVDIAEDAVAHAQSKYGSNTLSFRAGSVTHIPLEDASVDVVVSFETIEHIAEHEEMLAEVKRVLRHGGVLIISTPDKTTYSDATNYVNPYHIRELTRAEFGTLLSRYFANVRMHGQKIGFGSLIAVEQGEAPFVEISSASFAASEGLAAPMYLIAVASDDPANTGGLNGLFMQDIQASEPVQVRIEHELKKVPKTYEESLERTHAAVAKEIDWISSELWTMLRSNWMNNAPLGKLLRRLIKVRLLYALSRLSWLPERRRARFFRSAEKRDPMLLSARLDRFAHDYFFRIERNPVLAESARKVLARLSLKVSAIVPNYNHARYLRQRLDSILNQTYQPFEIIVLDDCSTDESRQIIDEYVARHPDLIKPVYNEQNSGSVFRQWQRGYEMATGDLVWICESDDFCEPNLVERLVSHFRDPSVMLAFGKIEFTDADGAFKPGMEHYRESAEAGIWGRSVVRPAATWFQKSFGVKNVIANVGGSIWRRVEISQSVWDEARTYRVMGDWFLYASLVKAGQIAFDPTGVAYFRIHGANTSGSNAQATPEYYREYARLMSSLKRRWPLPDETIDRFVGSCRSVYRRSGLPDADFEKLLPAKDLKAVPTEVPHVLIGLLGFSYGGGEIFPIHLANALARQGAMVSVLQMMDIEDHTDVRAMLDRGIPVYTANQLWERGIKSFVESLGVSIVHSHVANVEKLLLDEGKADLPYLSTLHGSYEAMDIGRAKIASWAAKVDRYGYTTDRNLTVFEGMKVPQEKFLKMRNAMPIDPRPYGRSRAEMGIPADAVVFTLVARGVAGKGWVEAITAFRSLRERRPDVPMALLAVGEGPKTDEAKAIAGNDPGIHFLGFDNAIHGIYRISDVALIPTRFPGESFPLCLIQAMQVGVPSVATDVGEIASMVRHDGRQAGLTVPYMQDDAAYTAALVDSMEQILEPELRKRLAADAAALGEDYSIDRLANDYIALYREVIAGRSKRK